MASNGAPELPIPHHYPPHRNGHANGHANGNGSTHHTMKSVFWEGKVLDVAVREVPKARLLKETDAVVRLTSAAICGTDLHTYRGIFASSKVPFPLGHEGVGVVVETGSAVQDIKIGDRVIVADFPDDGHFDLEPTLLPNFSAFGLGADFGNLGGLQAEFVRVPFADKSLEVIPHGIADKEYVLISDIFPTAWTGVDFSGFQPGDSIAVFGAGPVGLLAAYSAILRGASRVYSIDSVKARLDVAKKIGAIPIDFTKDGGPSAQILKLEPNGVQRVVDCVGEENVNQHLKPQENFILTEAIKMAAFGGGIGVVGVYFAEPNSAGTPRGATINPNITLPFTTFWEKNLSIKAGSVDSKILAPKLIELIQSGRARPGFVFSLEIGIDEAPLGYSRFNDHLETKVLITFPDEHGHHHREHRDGEGDNWNDNESGDFYDGRWARRHRRW